MSPDLSKAALNCAKGFLESHIAEKEQRDLLLKLMGHFSCGEPSPYLEIPLLVHGGIKGNTDDAMPIGGLGAFFFLGMDITDDIADGDADDHWPGYDTSELQLAASLFISAVPQMLISSLKTAPDVIVRIQERFAKGVMETAAGQQRELMMRGKTDVCVKDVENSVMGKSSGIATLASIAAIFAGASEEQTSHYEEVGRNLGVAAQLATDFHDLFHAPVSRDLKNGIRTLPIALYLEKCSAEERETFSSALKDAEKDQARRDNIRAVLFSNGIARLTAFIVELYCERARKNIDLAAPCNPYKDALHAYVNTVSFFGDVNRVSSQTPQK